MKRAATFILKVSVSAGLLWYLLARAEISAITASLGNVETIWLLVAFLLLIVGKFLSAYRWQMLLQAHHIMIPMRTLVASLYVGQFFNSFLPSTIGGDAIRAYDTAHYSQKTTRSVTTIFLDRLIGISALAFLGILALAIGLWSRQEVGSFTALIALTFGGCILTLTGTFSERVAAQLERVLRRLKLGKLARKIRPVHAAFLTLKNQPVRLLIAFLISFLLQVNVVLYYYYVSLALDLGIPLIFFFLIIPIILVILLVPFSINGIGLREGAYVFFLGMLNTPAEEAIALSLLGFGLMLTQTLVGGVIFALRGTDIKQMRADILKLQQATKPVALEK